MLPDPYPVKPWRAPCRGSVSLPGSKSLTNRALILSALTKGTVQLEGALVSRDSRLLVQNLQALGFEVSMDEAKRSMVIRGEGGSIPESVADLFVGNAGTAARFLTAFVCLHPDGRYRFDGDEEMRKRPMEGLLDCLTRLGARVAFEGERNCFPFEIQTTGLPGGNWSVDAGASSQMLSALMMVAPFASENVFLSAPGVRPAFVQMTADLMHQYGVNLSGTPSDGYSIPAGQSYSPGKSRFPIEPDATAASYFMTLPLVVGGSVLVRGMHSGLLQGDTAYAGVLRDLGMGITEKEDGLLVEAPEVYTAEARAFSFRTFSDTFLTLAAVAPLLPAPVTISGINHTRYQETDRIHAMAEGLGRAGAQVSTDEGSITVGPGGISGSPKPVFIDSYKDHRVAMSFGILGCRDVLGTGEPWLYVRDPACCAKTFPAFFEELELLYRNSHDK
ncbi:3-phosphoshikimate 1-carboxyvinyltransferase [Puniceicoccales bacterium CK1056]|uniref:3-phosphoshikimate 1-carboxyvinyltransferase n=1 Tax=Oceanipulchritudo coccoides TaxID=2706888 RepID=A0A6B2M2J6_9BACT|nr:3-phosphoshikimate 1-carboxyvinyltransferase [Oceanipulchritudo coccoides]NDV62025.1 3-phosphoshikimate 1-carboxyvinyltransferase [Oceanipulchritudo coccoides]